MRTKRAVSSGGIIFRRAGEGLEVAIARRKEDVWCLPKGLVEEGEELEGTALREVEEETGLSGKIVDKIGVVDYWFYWKPEDVRYHKFVHFYLVEYQKGSVENHDYELEEVRWVSIDEAVKMLSYKSEAEMVEKAERMLRGRGGGK